MYKSLNDSTFKIMSSNIKVINILWAKMEA